MANIGLTAGPENYYVGGDYTVGLIANSVVETEVLDYIIPADTVLHGINVEAFVRVSNLMVTYQYSRFRIKAGTDGAEATYIQPVIACTASNNDQYVWLRITIDDLDWTQAQSISVTAQNDVANANLQGIGYILNITGW